MKKLTTEELIHKLKCQPPPPPAKKIEAKLHQSIGSLLALQKQSSLQQQSREQRLQFTLPPSDQINLLI